MAIDPETSVSTFVNHPLTAVLVSPITPSNPLPSPIFNDIAIGAAPKPEKVKKGHFYEVPKVPIAGAEGLLIQGGEDCAAVVHTQNSRVPVVATVMDGCSFSKTAAQASNIAAKAALAYAAPRVIRPGIQRHEITDMLGASLLHANEQVRTQTAEGATTGVIAAVSDELGDNGRQQIYLHVASVADPNVTLICEDSAGQIVLYKLVIPTDSLKQSMGDRGEPNENLPIQKVWAEREREIELKAQQTGLDPMLVRKTLTESGITTYIGDPKGPKVSAYRINLTQELFAKGITKVTVAVESDNAGDKMSNDTIVQAYKQTSSNTEFIKELRRIALEQNLDDFSMVAFRVGRTSINLTR